MSEKLENNTKTKPETAKIDGISAQINLSPGSETHRRFAEMLRNSGATTARSFVEMLMDAYENPSTDNSETIANLEMQIDDLKGENRAYEATCQNYELEIADLKSKLEEAQRLANENAEHSLGQQKQLEKMSRYINDAIVFKPHPVVAFFLDEMSRKTEKSPDEILQSLFIDDLQNPMANNLPYIVTSERIREVMDEIKQQHQDAGKQE